LRLKFSVDSSSRKIKQVGPIRILVVDDSIAWRSVVAGILRSSNWCVVEEASGALEAVRRSAEFQPELVLLDTSLPDLSGFEAARQIGTLAPRCKILLFSDFVCAATIGEAQRVGALGCIRKSDAAVDLLPAVRALLLGEKFVARDATGSMAEQRN
jgi:DNA-binding NarL/FixJ family response regulator